MLLPLVLLLNGLDGPAPTHQPLGQAAAQVLEAVGGPEDEPGHAGAGQQEHQLVREVVAVEREHVVGPARVLVGQGLEQALQLGGRQAGGAYVQFPEKTVLGTLGLYLDQAAGLWVAVDHAVAVLGAPDLMVGYIT